MKKIKIQNYSNPDTNSVFISQNRFGVYLGNGLNVTFKSKYKVKNFLAEVNRFLNSKMIELNYIYIDVFAEFRRIWFIFPAAYSVENLFNSIDKHFNNLIKCKQSPNSNAFSFVDLIQICENLKEVIKSIKFFCNSKKDYNTVNYLKSIENRIKRIESEVESYGK